MFFRKRNKIPKPLTFKVCEMFGDFAIIEFSRTISPTELVRLFQSLRDIGIEFNHHIQFHYALLDIKNYTGKNGPLTVGEVFNFKFTVINKEVGGVKNGDKTKIKSLG